MKNFFFFCIILLSLLFIFEKTIYSQLGNSNMTLIANKNEHPTNNTYKYSACWGYVAPNGREYAIIGCQPGTAFYDITDTANVHEVGFQTGPTSEWREMKVYSHYAYIVSEASNSRLQIVDLQYLPDSIHFVRTFTFGNYSRTHSIQQDGPYLYLNGGNCTSGMANSGGTRIIDLTQDPENPTARGGWGTQYVHDCRVRFDTIWACNIYPQGQGGTGSIYVINAGNKDAPVTVNSWVNNPNPFPHNCALMPGRTYCLTTDETDVPPGKLKVWNVSNLSNVTLVASWQPTNLTNTIVHNVEIYGIYALVAHYEAGIRLVDISNPASPTEVAWYDCYPTANVNQFYGCWGVFMFPSGKIIGSDTQTGLYVVKTTFPLVGINDPPVNNPESFELKQNYPNPFNPSTAFEYTLPHGEYVTLKVFDVLGKQEALLVDSYQQAGNHMVTFDASRLASGVYFYTLSAGSFAQTKKMVLNK